MCVVCCIFLAPIDNKQTQGGQREALCIILVTSRVLRLYHVIEQSNPTWVRLLRQAAIKQRGLDYSCQLDFLVCFTRLTKRDTKLNHPHPVEAGRARVLLMLDWKGVVFHQLHLV